ncbi:unnamed protein product, partial [Sphacelaria rigidula]
MVSTAAATQKDRGAQDNNAPVPPATTKPLDLQVCQVTARQTMAAGTSPIERTGEAAMERIVSEKVVDPDPRHVAAATGVQKDRLLSADNGKRPPSLLPPLIPLLSGSS